MCAFNSVPVTLVPGALKISGLLLLTGMLIGCGPDQRDKALSAENSRLVSEQVNLKQQLADAQAELQSAKSQLIKSQIAASPVDNPAQQTEKLGITQPAAELVSAQEPVAEATALPPDTTTPQAPDTTEQLQELSAQRDEALAALETLQQEAAHLKTANEQAETRTAQTMEEKTQLNADLATAKAAADELRRSAEELQAQQETIKSEMESSRKDIQSSRLENKSLRKDMESSRTENKSLKQRLAQLEGHTETLAQEKENLNARLAQTAGQLGSAQNNAAKLSADYEMLLREKSDLTADGEVRRAELESARARLENAQTEVARLTGARGIYTVQDIDSLSTIAAFFYRDGNQWPKILQANSFLTTNPDLIFSGMVLIIPQ